MDDVIELLKAFNFMNKTEKVKARKLLKLYTDTNEVYIPFYSNKSRYLVLMGGGGSGKSIFAGQKILHRLTTEKGHRFLIVRKVAKTLRESCFQQLKDMILNSYNINDFDVNKTDMRITYKPFNNELVFAGLDDVEKLKSIYNITSIWIEEASELEPEDFRQLDIRLRGETKHYKQMIFSFNPVTITHWLKSEFFDVKKPDTTTSHTTYRDNKFLDEAAITVLEGFKITDPYYYDVYCRGLWGIIGKIVFDAQKVTNRIAQIRDNPCGMVGRIENKGGKHEFVHDANGNWTIYKEPSEKQKFVIGADVAEGNEWGDYDACHVLDTLNYKQYAVFHGHVDLDVYAEELIKGGYYFNTALICPEVNFNPGLVLNLERLHYSKLYMQKNEDTIDHKIKMKYGFRTMQGTRQAIISDLIEFARDHIEMINDIKTLEEMLTFVRDDKGKPSAQKGKHDDLVMSLAIALHAAMSGQGGGYSVESVKKVKIHNLPSDCQDDYYKASPEDKLILEKKWGLIK